MPESDASDDMVMSSTNNIAEFCGKAECLDLEKSLCTGADSAEHRLQVLGLTLFRHVLTHRKQGLHWQGSWPSHLCYVAV